MRPSHLHAHTGMCMSSSYSENIAETPRKMFTNHDPSPIIPHHPPSPHLHTPSHHHPITPHLHAQLLGTLRTLQQRIQRAEVAALCGRFQVTLQATQLASLQLLRSRKVGEVGDAGDDGSLGPLRDAFLMS